MGTLTAQKIMRRVLGRAQEAGVAAQAVAQGVAVQASASSTSMVEAARIVQTLIDGGRAKRVEKLERLATVPEGGVTLPVVADGVLKTMGTDAIMAKLNENFRKELDRLVVGQVPVITNPEIDEITDDDINNKN